MALTMRAATEADLEAIASLTRANRHRLAGWAPQWWAVAEGADDLHPLFLAHLVTSDGPEAHVVVDGDAVVGFLVALPQPGQWFVDDLAVVDDARWDDVAPVLVAGIGHRPALTCLSSDDRPRAEALERAGCPLVSHYWVRSTDGIAPAALPATEPDGVPDPPPHSFGGRLDPDADGALVIADEAGVVIGTPPTSAPPVYDPGGTVCVVDRVVGADRGALLARTLGGAAARGDVLVAVVCGAGDRDLASALAAQGFVRTVDVRAFPT